MIWLAVSNLNTWTVLLSRLPPLPPGRLTLADQETPSRCSKDDKTVKNACRDTQRESPGAAEEEEEASQDGGRGRREA